MKSSIKRHAALVALTALAFVTSLGVSFGGAQAASAKKPPMQDWTFKQSGLRIGNTNIMTDLDIFGYFDKAQLQRGFQVFREVCNGCHSLNLVAYRHLEQIGFSEDEVKEIAAEYEVLAGPNDDGEVLDEDGAFFVRPAIPADKFYAPYPNNKAAEAANGGALPPDLSLMTKARLNGPDYLYALLTGYKDEVPEDLAEDFPEGKYFNEWFPGHAISMAQPLYDESVEYEDGSPNDLASLSRDVTAFLAWAAEPELEERASLGIKVILFLIVWTALMFALKKQIWRKVH